MRLSDANTLRFGLAAVAQVHLDQWRQDADGFHEVLGHGGICQDIATAMSDLLAEAGCPATAELYTEQEGGHVFVMALFEEGAFMIDIPPRLYETGAGYVWRKRPGVRLCAEDVLMMKMEGPMSEEEFLWRYTECECPCP